MSHDEPRSSPQRDGRGSRHSRRTDQRGASAVEYGLLIAGIAAVIALAVYAFGGSVIGLFDDTCKTVSGNSATCAQD